MPAYVTEAARRVVQTVSQTLVDAMLAAGDDPTDSTLWQQRRSQYRALFAQEIERWGQ